MIMPMSGSKRHYLWLGIVVLFAMLGGAGWWYVTHSARPVSYSKITGQSQAITKLPEPGRNTSIVVDYANCSRGHDSVSYGLGHTVFAFEGISNGTCVFHMGGEIEDPRWDGALPTTCRVPTSEGKQKYAVRDDGISWAGLEQRYCH